MSLSAVASDSHLERNSTASLFRNVVPTSEAAVAMPRMLQRYRETQLATPFAALPFELDNLLLSALTGTAQPGSPLLRFGLTCKYWHLRVRNQIENTAEGRQFRQAFEHNRYAASHGLTPVEHAKDKIRWRAAEQLERWASNWCGCDHADHPGETRALGESMHLALADDPACSSRGGPAPATHTAGLTVLDFLSKTNDVECLINTIRATPRGSYVALAMRPLNYSAQDARRIADEMAANPVVCFVQIGDDAFVTAWKGADFDLNLLAACAERGVDSCQFSLMYDVLNKDKASQLAEVIRTIKCGITIEIWANKVEAECMALIFDAVMFCNQSCSPTLNLRFKGSDISEVVGRMVDTTHAQMGIHVQYLNEAHEANDTDAGSAGQNNSSDQELDALLAQLDWSADSSDDERGADAEEQ